MKRFSALPALVFLTAATALGGVTYDFRMVTTGAQEMTIAGSVESDGQNLRMAIDRGDALVFKDGSIVLSRDGGKNLFVFDSSAKTYFQMTLDDITRGAADAFKSPLVKVTFDAPKVSVHDDGDGGTIEGFPARKMTVDAWITINIDAMGQKLKSSMAIHSDNWSTDKIDPAARNLFQLSNPRTGIEALDKVMDGQASAFIGRFPLKQVTTLRVTQDGRDIVTTSTATVTNIRMKALDAATFADPAGYAKVDNPMEAMKKRAN